VVISEKNQEIIQPMRIDRKDSAGLVIDIQERLFPHIESADQLLKRCTILLKGLEVLGVPAMVTEQYRKGLGPTLEQVALNLPAFSPMEKMTFSCCDDAQVMKSLNNQGKKTVIICGIEAHVCVLQTAIDLIANDFLPVIVEDCTGSRKQNDKRVALERMRSEGAIVTTSESILFELARVSGTDEFKAISKLVK